MASPEPSVSDDTPNSPVTEEILGEVANVVVKDEQYYMQFVTLLVEDTLFMVPKHLFTRSCNFFSWMSDEDVETKSHELEGVSKTDFQALLKLIYPLNLPLEPVLSESEWISVLKLSSLWTMIDLRERAIDSLRSLESIQKVLLARTYGISTWLHSGYVDLASRNAALSIEDAHSLGLETAVKLIDIRERRYSSHTAGHGGQSTTGKSIVDAEFSGKIQDVQTVNSGDIADMLLWAKAVGNAQSLRLAYIDFVERSTAITLEEALKLGDETTINISQAREKLQNSLGRLIWSLESVSQELKVYDAFAEEFATIANVGALYARAPDLNQETQTTVPVRDHVSMIPCSYCRKKKLGKGKKCRCGLTVLR
ncbi:hypothetical protein H0H93_010354 [Arthromyces matolae]|nr:hypothetical protein H0H93_010354 [Arthromyces matolae]